MSFRPKKILQKTFALLLKTVGLVSILLLLTWLLLQTQWGKNLVKDQAVKYLQTKLKTKIAVAEIQVAWFSHIKLTGVYVEDKEKRKLLGIGELDMHYDISDIFSNKLDIPQLKVSGLEVNIYRRRTDSVYNFSFIPAAFSTAGKTESADTTAGNAFVLGLGKLSLNNVKFLMDDQFGGQHYQLEMDSVFTEVEKLNLESLRLHVKRFTTHSLTGNISLFTPFTIQTPAKTIASSPHFDLEIDSAELNNTSVSFQNTETGMKIQSGTRLFGGSNFTLSLAKKHIAARYLTLKGNKSSVLVKSIPDNKISDDTDTNSFTYYAGKMDIDSGDIVFDDVAFAPVSGKQVDYHHFNIKDINIHTDSTGYNGTVYFSQVNHISAIEKSGFSLQELSGSVAYADSFISLKQLKLLTPLNKLSGNVFVSYPSVEHIVTKPAATLINVKINHSSLQLDELLLFNKALANNPSFKPLLGKRFFLNTNINGTLHELDIPALLMQQAGLKIAGSARVYHPLDATKLKFDLVLKDLSGKRKDLLALLPANTIPDSLMRYIPENFSATGIFKGGLNDFYTDIHISSSTGNVSIKGTAKNITDRENAQYDALLNSSNLDVANLLADTSFGKLSGSVKINGKGYTPSTMSANYDMRLNEVEFKRYNYKNVSLTGSFDMNKLKAHIQANDPNLQLLSDIYVDVNKSKGSLKTNTSIDKINFARLGFTKDTLILSGKIDADFPTFDTTAMNGKAHITALTIRYNDHNYKLDTLNIFAKHDADTQFLFLKTAFADASLKGRYTFTNLGPAVSFVIGSYAYKEGTVRPIKRHADALLQMNFYLPDSLANVFGLKSIKPFSTYGYINTDSATLRFQTKIPGLRYNEYIIDTVSISAHNNRSAAEGGSLAYLFKVDRVTAPSFTLPESMAGGNIRQGKIDGSITLLDDDRDPRYVIPYTITNDTLQPYVHIHDSLVINKRKWAVNRDNIVYLSTKKLQGSHLVISNGDESMSIAAEGDALSGLPVTVRFKNFRLRNFSEIVVADTAFLTGETNGVFSINNLADFTFTSDLLIDSLVIKEVPAGDLTMKISQQTKDKLSVDISLAGQGNDVSLRGTYDLKESRPVLFLEMSPLNVQTIQPVTSPYLSSLKGRVQGSLNINGTLEKPEIIGALLLDSIKAVYRDYNTFISIPSSGLSFEEGAIHFSPLNFTDSAGNNGVITGNIFTENYTDYRFDLRMRATNFTMVGIKKFPDQAAYGPTSADALINISGTMKTIVLDGSVNVVGKSSFTYIYRPDELSPEGDGLVEFFDPAHPEDTVAIKRKIEKTTSALQMAMNIYLAVQPEAKVTIMLDEVTGDNLTIQGTANFNATMNAGGQMYLTGNYTVEQGTYDLSIASLIRRKFSIEKNSTITWSGDPMRGEMNITAVYKTRTTAGELVTDQQNVTGIDRQQMNFEVYLLLTGELLKPKISFRIDMDEADQQLFNGIVYTRIKQINSIEAELNKQVMGLLAINNFIADNPFSSLAGGGPSFETQAYATAGRLLTQELTELLGQAIKGVAIDFGFDVNENYTSGTAQRNTNFKVGIRKSVANNRLHIYVGSSFALEGQNQNADALAGLAGDVTLEYLLTKDGKYRIKAYRINQTELTFQAAIIKTGVSFVVVVEFNKLQNLFRKRKNKQPDNIED